MTRFRQWVDNLRLTEEREGNDEPRLAFEVLFKGAPPDSDPVDEKATFRLSQGEAERLRFILNDWCDSLPKKRSVENVCAHCHTAIPDHAKNCPGCGTVIE